MAKTKTKPGPKPQYGKRTEVHVQLPDVILLHISEVTNNRTKWLVEAAQEKMERERTQS